MFIVTRLPFWCLSVLDTQEPPPIFLFSQINKQQNPSLRNFAKQRHTQVLTWYCIWQGSRVSFLELWIQIRTIEESRVFVSGYDNPGRKQRKRQWEITVNIHQATSLLSPLLSSFLPPDFVSRAAAPASAVIRLPDLPQTLIFNSIALKPNLFFSLYLMGYSSDWAE